MPVIPAKGPRLGRVNLIDFALVIGACLVGAALYVRLSPGYRIAPPYPGDASDWVTIELQLPPGMGFLCDSAQAGLTARDPRTGADTARVQGCDATDPPRVTVQLRAAQDAQGRWFHDNTPLLPGQPLRIETSACILEGRIATVQRPVPGSG